MKNKKTKGIFTRAITIIALSLILVGYALTARVSAWLVALLLLVAVGAFIILLIRKIRSNIRSFVLPELYAEVISKRAKLGLEPEQIKLKKFVKTSKFSIAPGIPQRVIIDLKAPILYEKTDTSEVTGALQFILGSPYRLNHRKSKNNGLLVFDALTAAEVAAANYTPELTYRQSIESRFTQATARLVDENAVVNFTWENEDYLKGVEVTGFQTTDIALPNKRKQVMLQLKTTLPKGDFNTYFDPHDRIIRFFRSTPLPTVTAPPAAKARLIKTHEDYLKFKIQLAIGPDGQPAFWHPSKDAHLLCVGTTGGGKTIFEHGLIQQLCQAGARVWLIDGKRVEFKGYRNYPNVEILAQKIEQQVRVVKMAFDLMEKRYALIEEDKVTIAELEPVFLIIDEVKTFLNSAERLYKKTKVKGMPAKSEILDWLSDMGSLARTAKIHLVFGLQRPDAEFIGGELRDNFGARFSMGQLQSNIGSMMMWNNPAVGVQVPKIPGRAVSLIDGVPVQVQVPFTANPDPQHKDFVASMVAATYPEWDIYSRKEIGEPQPETIYDNKGEVEDCLVTWESIITARLIDPKTGRTVQLPPVASEESRALRASDVADAPVDPQNLMPREVSSFQEALEIFSNRTNLTYGASVARALIRFCKADTDNITKPASALESYEEATRKLQSKNLAFDEEKEIAAEKITGGMRITDPDTGEKILVSETTVLDGAGQIAVVGLTDDGEEVTLDLPLHQKIEYAELLEV